MAGKEAEVRLSVGTKLLSVFRILCGFRLRRTPVDCGDLWGWQCADVAVSVRAFDRLGLPSAHGVFVRCFLADGLGEASAGI